MPRARTKGKRKRKRGNHWTAVKNKKKKIHLPPTSEPSMPREIIFEILSWLSVESILRCKCVCKMWYSIIQDHYFIYKHMNRTASEYRYTDASDGEMHYGNEETFEFLSYYSGLLLEKNKFSHKYHIRNPATRQILDLPDPREQVLWMTICFIPTTGDYKLINMYEEGSIDSCEVLTVGSDSSWRPLEIISLHNSQYTWFWPFGTVCFCIRLPVVGSHDSEIVCLDMESECFTNINVPQGFFSHWKTVKPLSWNGKLSLACIVEEELHVWVLENYRRQKWAERKIVIPLTFMKDYIKENLQPWTIEGSCLWINVNYEKRLVYDTEAKKIRYSTSAPKGKKILYYHRPSMVTLKGMQPAESKNKSTCKLRLD